MRQLHSAFERLLGLTVEPRDLTTAQMSARALVVFIATLFMLRLAHKRFFARRNPLDALLALIIASTLSRAINGSAAFFPTIMVGFGVVLLHRVLTWAAARFHLVEKLVKGTPVMLIENGRVNTAALHSHSLSPDDLQEDLRLNGVGHAEAVRSAALERNGEVSVIKDRAQ